MVQFHVWTVMLLLPAALFPTAGAKCSRNFDCRDTSGINGEETICCTHPDTWYDKYGENPGCFVAKGFGNTNACIVPTTTTTTTTTTVTPTPTIANVFARMKCGATDYITNLLIIKIQTLDEQDSLALALEDLVGNGASFYFYDGTPIDPLSSNNCPKDVETLNNAIGNGLEFYCESGGAVMLRNCSTQLPNAGAPPTTTTVATTATVTTVTTATTITITTTTTATTVTTVAATTVVETTTAPPSTTTTASGVIRGGERCAYFDNGTGQNVDDCSKCEEGTVGTKHTGVSIGTTKTCEVPDGVVVDWCPKSPEQLCDMACGYDSPTCKTESECAMRQGQCCEFECEPGDDDGTATTTATKTTAAVITTTPAPPTTASNRCQGDGDCDATMYCTSFVCSEYQEEGDSCQQTVSPADHTKCADGLLCRPPKTAPGTRPPLGVGRTCQKEELATTTMPTEKTAVATTQFTTTVPKTEAPTQAQTTTASAARSTTAPTTEAPTPTQTRTQTQAQTTASAVRSTKGPNPTVSSTGGTVTTTVKATGDDDGVGGNRTAGSKQRRKKGSGSRGGAVAGVVVGLMVVAVALGFVANQRGGITSSSGRSRSTANPVYQSSGGEFKNPLRADDEIEI